MPDSTELLSLNCFVDGDQPNQTFPVEVPKTKNVGILKKIIKEEKSPHLNHVAASDLEVFLVSESFPIDDLASRHPPTDGTPLRPNKRLSSLFVGDPSEDDLHICVKAPPKSNAVQLLLLNCFILGDKPGVIFNLNETFPVEVPKTKNVGILKKMIKEEKPHRLKHVDASDLILNQVSLPVDDGLAENLKRAELTPLNPVLPLSQAFPRVEERHLHIVVQAPMNKGLGTNDAQDEESTPTNLTRSCVLQPKQVALARQRFCESRSTAPPSGGAKPKEFRKGQEKAPINCNRPLDDVKTLPLHLSHPVFGSFMDDCESFKPSLEDKKFLNQFVVTMSKIYDAEKDRQTAILELLRTAGITMQPNKIIGTDYTTDGSSFFNGHLLYALAELKNEVCSTNSEPYLQAVLYFLEATRKYVSQYLHSGLPCIILLIFGPYIAFAGATWSGKPNVQMLTTAIPCHYHDSDIKMRDMLLRHLGAFRNASRSLEQYYQKLTPYGPLDHLSQCNPTYPYPTSFTSGPMIHTFRYLSEFASEYNYIFFGDLDSTAAQTVCIKFAHQYSEDVHRFCAAKGHAPKLHAVQRLPGGFYMVVMDDIGDEYISLDHFVDGRQEILSSPTYAALKESIQRFLEEMHRAGWVHGDLRTSNVMVKKGGLDESFLLIDFDWSGKNQEVVYPSFVNRMEVRRPDGVDDDINSTTILFRVGGLTRRTMQTGTLNGVDTAVHHPTEHLLPSSSIAVPNVNPAISHPTKHLPLFTSGFASEPEN